MSSSRLIFCFAVLSMLSACAPQPPASDAPSVDPAQEVVDSAIVAMGVSGLDDAHITFDFRNRTYVYHRKDGQYEYKRIFTDKDSSKVEDVLTNDGLIRYVNGAVAELDSVKRQAYSNSVNSVMYFAFLPFWLNDAAVIKKHLGEKEIKGRSYHELHVSFQQEKGGVDFEDNFLYWFDTEDYSMDYLAYDYIVNGGGVRLREAYNVREIDGLVLQDYINLKSPSKEHKLEEMMDLFQDSLLVELSKIEIDNITIHHLK